MATCQNSPGVYWFNFILTAIAVGGFFTIDPMDCFMVSSWSAVHGLPYCRNALLGPFQLRYILPFIVVVLFSLVSNSGKPPRQTRPCGGTAISPEKNLYSRLKYDFRFGHRRHILFAALFGEWWSPRDMRGPSPTARPAACLGIWIKDAEGLTYTGLGLIAAITIVLQNGSGAGGAMSRNC